MSVVLRRCHIAALLAAFILISAATIETVAVGPPGLSGLDWAGRRRLIGSAPPTCRRRCGRCWPCKAVRVTVHPGVAVPLDYYPEAWRCTCAGHLFMP